MSVFGIEGQGFNGTPLTDIDVKVMAGRYWSLIKSKQAIGPYMLVGHSFGGLVAVEVAEQALAAGEKNWLLDRPGFEFC
jgi:thioesterase domain-containing protein